MILRALLVLIIIVLTFVNSTSCLAQERTQFKLGVVVALTGAMSIHGEAIRDSLFLAKEKFDTYDQIKIIVENDEWLPKNTLSAVNKLITQDKVDGILVFGTNQGLAVVGTVEKAGLPFFSVNVNRAVVKGRSNSFLMMPSIEALTEQNIREARARGYKNIATVSTIQDSCLLQQKIFNESNVAPISTSLEILPTDQDLRDTANQIRKTKSDAVFLSTLLPQGAILARRLREVGFKGDFFAGIQEASFTEVGVSRGALVNAWLVIGDDTFSTDYYQSYEKKYSEKIAEKSFLGVYGYDTFRLILAGIESKNLTHYLHTLKGFAGASGHISADSANGFNFPVKIKRFTESGLH